MERSGHTITEETFAGEDITTVVPPIIDREEEQARPG